MEITKEKIEAELLELARLQQVVIDRLPVAKQMRAQMYAAYVMDYDTEIKAIEATVEAQDELVRSMMNTYLEETGDAKPHEAVSIIRAKKLVYDAGDVIQDLLALERYDLLRSSLKVREFESEWKKGDLFGVNVDEVSVNRWNIGRLGDLLILAETEQKGND